MCFFYGTKIQKIPETTKLFLTYFQLFTSKNTKKTKDLSYLPFLSMLSEKCRFCAQETPIFAHGNAAFTTKIRRIDRIKAPFPGNGNGTFSKALPIAQQEVCQISIRRIMLHVLTKGIVDAAGFTHTLLPFSQASAVGK